MKKINAVALLLSLFFACGSTCSAAPAPSPQSISRRASSIRSGVMISARSKLDAQPPGEIRDCFEAAFKRASRNLNYISRARHVGPIEQWETLTDIELDFRVIVVVLMDGGI